MGTTRIFRSEEKKKEILDAYSAFLAAMPFEKRNVNTSYGKTFALEAGDASKETVVLLHGSCTNSAFWFNEVMALMSSYHVLAIDIIGEAGNSEPYRPDLASGEYAEWLREAVHAFGLERFTLVGNSLGSWLALKYAVRWPEDVARLALLAPAGIGPQRYNPDDTAGSFDDEPPQMEPQSGMPDEIVAFINLILSGFCPIAEELPRYTECELMRLTMPILFVAGEDDELLDAPAAAKRLVKNAPQADIRLLPGAGHIIQNAAQYLVPYLTVVNGG